MTADCPCSMTSEYRNGGYYEHFLLVEPDCPIHGTTAATSEETSRG